MQALLDGSTINDQLSYLLSMCLGLKSKIAKISTLKVKRIAKSLKFDPVNNSRLKVVWRHLRQFCVHQECNLALRHMFCGCKKSHTQDQLSG